MLKKTLTRKEKFMAVENCKVHKLNRFICRLTNMQMFVQGKERHIDRIEISFLISV